MMTARVAMTEEAQSVALSGDSCYIVHLAGFSQHDCAKQLVRPSIPR